jgi:hypothetical protein
MAICRACHTRQTEHHNTRLCPVCLARFAKILLWIYGPATKTEQLANFLTPFRRSRKGGSAERGRATRRRLIAALSKAGGRATNTALAKTLGMAKTSIRHHGAILLKQGTIYKGPGFAIVWSLTPFEEVKSESATS